MSVAIAEHDVTVLLGDVREQLATLPDGSVQCVVTSPPYYGLRDYGCDGQIGLEASPAEYVETMRAVFAEVRRVLAADGTLWLNWRVAFALIDDGWTLRNAIVWNKPNAMPESVRDRLSCRYEHVFLFSKSSRYWFDLEAVKVPSTMLPPGNTAEDRQRYGAATGTKKGSRRFGGNPGSTLLEVHETRNPGDVWTIPTSPFPGAHFACMAPALARRCILASCPAGGTVLDPFVGSGTTLMVARQLGLKSVGIEINPADVDIIRGRIGETPLDFGRPPTCPDCGAEHDPEPCRREAADCDCCRAIERSGASA